MIFLIVGDSGVGKSTIVSNIKNKLENVNIIKSYTTRPKRNEKDNDHIFIKNKNEIKDEIIASTNINGYFYCTVKSQFQKGKINIYIVDDKGIVDTKNYFKDFYKIITLHINRKNVNVSEERKIRKIEKLNIKYDEEINNDGDIETTTKEVLKCIKKYQKKN